MTQRAVPLDQLLAGGVPGAAVDPGPPDLVAPEHPPLVAQELLVPGEHAVAVLGGGVRAQLALEEPFADARRRAGRSSRCRCAPRGRRSCRRSSSPRPRAAPARCRGTGRSCAPSAPRPSAGSAGTSSAAGSRAGRSRRRRRPCASPLDSRMPSTYPLRRVQLPTTRLKEKVSPGRISTPSTRADASRRLVTLLCCSSHLGACQLAQQQRAVPLAPGSREGLVVARGRPAGPRTWPSAMPTPDLVHPHRQRVERRVPLGEPGWRRDPRRWCERLGPASAAVRHPRPPSVVPWQHASASWPIFACAARLAE